MGVPVVDHDIGGPTVEVSPLLPVGRRFTDIYLHNIHNIQTYSQTSFIRTAWYPLKCSDCETRGLLNHCIQKMIKDVTRNSVRIVRNTE